MTLREHMRSGVLNHLTPDHITIQRSSGQSLIVTFQAELPHLFSLFLNEITPSRRAFSSCSSEGVVGSLVVVFVHELLLQ